MSSQNLATTFNYKYSKEYKEALTNARPSSWIPEDLWFRLPTTVKWKVKAIEDNLIIKIKESLTTDWQESKDIILGVFLDLFMTLETWFTREQAIEIVWNLDKFTHDEITPINPLNWVENTHIFEQYHWPTDAFKDIALQMVTSMTSLIVQEQNEEAIRKAKEWIRGQKLKFLVTQTSTSWDTWPAGWSWIEGKNFILNVIGFPENEATYSQKGQMINLGGNVLSLPMNRSFSDIQELMKDCDTPEFNEKLVSILNKEFADLIEEYWFEIEVDTGSFNSINPWRVDWQMLYHSEGILQAKAKNIIQDNDELIEVIPSWNGGHVFSNLMARLQTEQKWKTIVTCNRNNMFYKIIEEWKFFIYRCKNWWTFCINDNKIPQ